jgi:ubiquinone/menaquinone biosynthesis C-methylase UbiE
MNFDASNAKSYAQSNIVQRGWATRAWNDFMTLSSASSASFKKILDMGCGSGDITEDLVKWNDLKDLKDGGLMETKKPEDGANQVKGPVNKEIVGTDISLQMISFCNEEREKSS